MFCNVVGKSCVQILQGPETLPGAAWQWRQRPPPVWGWEESWQGLYRQEGRARPSSSPWLLCQEIIQSN